MKSPATPLIALIGTLSLTCWPSLGAQPTEPEQDNSPALEEATPHQGFLFDASISTTVAMDADFDNDIGEFSYNRLAAEISASRVIGSRSALSFKLAAGRTAYNITPSPTSVAGDAASIGAEFDDVVNLSLSTLFATRANEKSSWFVGGGMAANFESSANFDDSIDWMITGGYTRHFSDKLQIGLGLAARTQLDDDVLVIPVPQLKYTIDEYWSVSSKNIGLKINYKASEQLDYGFSGEFASTTFRLDDSHAFAAKGMTTHRRVPVGFYAQYKPNDLINISGQVGALISGEIEILDTNGNDIATQDIDTGVFGSLTLTFKF